MEFLFIEPANDFSNGKLVLKAYHEDFKKRGKQLLETVASIQKQGMTAELAQNCVAFYCQYSIANQLHQQDEEMLVFPLAVQTEPELREIIKHLEVEHEEINKLWDALTEQLTEPEEVDDFETLQSLIVEFELKQREHLEREEQMLLPKITALFNESQWQALGIEMEKSRNA
ncbi:MAG: hypothetical protein GQ569_14630 [Methylococcaceae bacterium]|nr:hypothetical protein [Methylococcaceae bacterium]